MIKVDEFDHYDYLGEMAKVGTFYNIEIFVRTNDPGKIPHFHFLDKNKDKDNEGCIRIDRPEYFDHEGKKLHLNSSQRKEMVEFLKSSYRRKSLGITNWEYLVLLWNDNNSDVEIDDDTEMPDYTKLR